MIPGPARFYCSDFVLPRSSFSLCLVPQIDGHRRDAQDAPNDLNTHITRQNIARQLSDATAHGTMSVTFPTSSMATLSIDQVTSLSKTSKLCGAQFSSHFFLGAILRATAAPDAGPLSLFARVVAQALGNRKTGQLDSHEEATVSLPEAVLTKADGW